jgi:hypothetical protein
MEIPVASQKERERTYPCGWGGIQVLRDPMQLSEEMKMHFQDENWEQKERTKQTKRRSNKTEVGRFKFIDREEVFRKIGKQKLKNMIW